MQLNGEMVVKSIKAMNWLQHWAKVEGHQRNIWRLRRMDPFQNLLIFCSFVMFLSFFLVLL